MRKGRSTRGREDKRGFGRKNVEQYVSRGEGRNLKHPPAWMSGEDKCCKDWKSVGVSI